MPSKYFLPGVVLALLGVVVLAPIMGATAATADATTTAPQVEHPDTDGPWGPWWGPANDSDNRSSHDGPYAWGYHAANGSSPWAGGHAGPAPWWNGSAERPYGPYGGGYGAPNGSWAAGAGWHPMGPWMHGRMGPGMYGGTGPWMHGGMGPFGGQSGQFGPGYGLGPMGPGFGWGPMGPAYGFGQGGHGYGMAPGYGQAPGPNGYGPAGPGYGPCGGMHGWGPGWGQDPRQDEDWRDGQSGWGGQGRHGGGHMGGR